MEPQAETKATLCILIVSLRFLSGHLLGHSEIQEAALDQPLT